MYSVTACSHKCTPLYSRQFVRNVSTTAFIPYDVRHVSKHLRVSGPRSRVQQQVKRPEIVFNQYLKAFSTNSTSLKKSDALPPRPTLPDSDLKHVYLKGSGPGGQKINKTSSAVQITHIPTGIVVKSQATRSQSQNHTIAKRILAEKIELLEKGSESRAAKKIERAQKKKASSAKKKRRKYRKLAAQNQEQDQDEDEDQHGYEDYEDEAGARAEAEAAAIKEEGSVDSKLR